MGLLTDYVIKDERKKKIAFWIRDLGILAVFAYLAIGHKNTWEAGYEHCAKDACMVCWGEMNLTVGETIETAGKGDYSSIHLSLWRQNNHLGWSPPRAVARAL